MSLVFGVDGTAVHALAVDSDGQLQIDLASALPAGSNLVGRVDARDGDKVFSLSDTVLAFLTNVVLVAGNNTLLLPAVPAGEVHVITTMSMSYSGTAPSAMYGGVHDGVGFRGFFGGAGVTLPSVVTYAGTIFLAAGQSAGMFISGATAGDLGNINIFGYKMTAP